MNFFPPRKRRKTGSLTGEEPTIKGSQSLAAHDSSNSCPFQRKLTGNPGLKMYVYIKKIVCIYYMYMYIRIYVYTYIYTPTYIPTCIHICICICICKCICVHLYMCISYLWYVCVDVYIYIYICLCIYNKNIQYTLTCIWIVETTFCLITMVSMQRCHLQAQRTFRPGHRDSSSGESWRAAWAKKSATALLSMDGWKRETSTGNPWFLPSKSIKYIVSWCFLWIFPSNSGRNPRALGVVLSDPLFLGVMTLWAMQRHAFVADPSSPHGLRKSQPFRLPSDDFRCLLAVLTHCQHATLLDPQWNKCGSDPCPLGEVGLEYASYRYDRTTSTKVCWSSPGHLAMFHDIPEVPAIFTWRIWLCSNINCSWVLQLGQEMQLPYGYLT